MAVEAKLSVLPSGRIYLSANTRSNGANFEIKFLLLWLPLPT
jgi:hypothetical protein